MDAPLEKAIQKIIETVSPDKIILFGSRATGNALPDSDYDLLVLKNGLTKKNAVTGIIYKNLINIGAPVDIIVTDTESFEKNKTNPYMIYMEADVNGKILYER
ncbi:MAG: nucleotidyltransferase domain-containing protein [Firmicutes bacterium]|nr:nucleotidyltransferase domain-containing protein [Bacillota bacterium]